MNPWKKTIVLIAKAAEKQGTPLNIVAEYLPPVAGSYLAHVGEASKWVTPAQIVNTNIKMFQKCMEVLNGRIVLSCISTGAICLLTLIPGPHQPSAILLCQTMVLFTKNV